eukprot:TRINITY_DN65989_c5_g10_i1.p1 TRINITY_DN65989_c5_g10~~TRINITY_DN65989_c5_g10_i1.p1  ORF type:complete len:313 (-),score=142.59 TRINITY_DN65989_c5_g10_i1:84-1022(-)
MGNDGGTIPHRQDLVKKRKRVTKENFALAQRSRWSLCAISQRPLQAPVVLGPLGNLFNKDAVIQQHLLLPPDQLSVQFAHIKSLKDLLELNLVYPREASDLSTASAAASASTVSSSDGDKRVFMCPLTKLEGGGRHPFIAMRQCGCVLSERAYRQVSSEQCLVCGKDVPREDVAAQDVFIRVLPSTPAQIEEARAKLSARHERWALAKKSKKKNKNKKKKKDKKNKSKEGENDKSTNQDTKSNKKRKSTSSSSSSSSSVAAAVASDIAKAAKRAKTSANGSHKSDVYNSIFYTEADRKAGVSFITTKPARSN